MEAAGFSSLYDTGLAALAETGPDLRLVRVNNALLREAGPAAPGTPLPGLFAPASRILFETHILPMLFAGRSVQEIQLEWQLENGARKPVLLQAEPMPGIGFRFLMVPYVERVQLEKQLVTEAKTAKSIARDLAAANRELERYAHVVTHDLNAPVGNLRNIADLLISDLQDKLNARDLNLLQHISRAADQLLALIRGVHEFHSALRGYDDRLEVLDAGALTGAVRELFPGRTDLVWTTHQVPLAFRGNRTLLMQVLLNLVSNAIRYNDKPEIRIGMEIAVRNGQLEFAVSDNGPGVAPEFRDRLFRMFTPMQALDRDGRRGTGLGLATVHRIALLAGGTAFFQPVESGGAIFGIRIPYLPV